MTDTIQRAFMRLGFIEPGRELSSADRVFGVEMLQRAVTDEELARRLQPLYPGSVIDTDISVRIEREACVADVKSFMEHAENTGDEISMDLIRLILEKIRKRG